GGSALKKKLAFPAMIIICMAFLLYLMNETYYKLAREVATNATISTSTYIAMSALVFLFGVIIDWNALNNVIKGQVNVRWLLFISAIILAIITFIPTMYWTLWFGSDKPIYIDILWKPETHVLLTVFSGILLIRSLGGKD